MQIEYVHHVQIPYPPDQETMARHFYGEVLGLRELARPAALADQPGMWFDLGHGQQVHLLATHEGFGSANHHFAVMLNDLAEARTGLRERAGAGQDTPGFAGTGSGRLLIHGPFGNAAEP